MKKEIRQKVYEKYGGHCAYCGKELKLGEMQVDHIFPQHLRHIVEGLNEHGHIGDATRQYYGNPPQDINAIENLNPSCRRCNHYKRADTLEQFRVSMKTLHERIRKNYINKVGEDYGIITITPFDGKFYFERI